ncbi:MAG TPA: hypothetical protein VK908_02150 [Jiangellales bacterium]|nr:hypothetical protein [Jiangellales bacterium]
MSTVLRTEILRASKAVARFDHPGVVDAVKPLDELVVGVPALEIAQVPRLGLGPELVFDPRRAASEDWYRR